MTWEAPSSTRRLASAESRGGDHVGPDVVGELDRRDADSPGATVDQDPFVRLQASVIQECLIRRERSQWQRGRFDVRHVAGSRRHFARSDDRVLGGGTVAVEVDEAVDLVTDLEVRDAWADLRNDTRQFVGWDDRGAVSAVASSP